MKNFALNKTEIKLWLITFLALGLTFSPLFFNFVWGNHDWSLIFRTNLVTSGILEGRFSQFILPTLLLNRNILPILSIGLGLMFYSLALILLYFRFFEFKTNRFTPVIFITTATLPYIIEIIYFHFIVLSQLSWTLTITLSLLCAKKASQSPHPLVYTVIATSLLLFTIGGYPASINLFACAAYLWFIKNFFTKTPFLKQIKDMLPFAISLITALLILYIIYYWLLKENIMMAMYNNQTVSIQELIMKIFPTIGTAIRSFIQPQPFFSLAFKVISSLILLIFAITFITTRNNLKEKGLAVLLLGILLLAVKFSAWLISESTSEYFPSQDPAAYMVRTDFYSIPCLMLFCLTYLLQNLKQYLKNIIYTLTILLLCLNLKADLLYAKTFIFGFKAESDLKQRVINRIKESPKYDPYVLYTIVQAGEISLRSKYYTPKKFEKFGYYTFKTPYTRHWIPNEHYSFYEDNQFVIEGRAIRTNDLSDEMIDFLINKNFVWPSPNSVYVDKNYSIIILTKEGQKMMADQFKQLGE